MYDPFGKVKKIFLRKAEDTKNEIIFFIINQYKNARFVPLKNIKKRKIKKVLFR
jgi:hypothetical protein